MRLDVLDMISLPGNPARPNDDAFCHSDALAAVFDGATGLGEQILPVDSDAAWIARRGAEGLIQHQAPGRRPRDVLAETARDAETLFKRLRLRAPKETYEIPFASMMLVAIVADGLEALWFGDCVALVKRPHDDVVVVGEAFAKRAREAGGVVRLASARGVSAPAASRNLPEFMDFLRSERNGVNTKPDRWLFSPDGACAGHAQSRTIAAPPGTDILLASDGFLALASDYERYDAAGLLAAAKSKGLRALCDALREIERGDPDGARYPRFKTSDDATAILLSTV